VRGSITIYRFLSRMVSLFNTSHLLFLDICHRICYDSAKETSKAKGDTRYADRF
jgi:hypothetical protein